MSDAADNLVLRHLRELRAHMDDGFAGVHTRLDLHEERFVKVEGHLADLRGLVFDTRNSVGRLETKMEKVETDVGDTRSGVTRLEARMEKVENDVGATRTDVQTVVRRLDSLETTLRVSERLTDLEHQVAELRRQAR